MKRFWRNYCDGNIPFYVFSGIAIILLIISFILPPTGFIDSSVILAVSEIFAFASLWTVIKAIDKGKTASVRKGDISLTVGDNNNDNDVEE